MLDRNRRACAVKPVASAPAAPDKAPPSFTDPGAAAAIVGGYHSTPFDILGIHRHTVDGKPVIVIRTFQPQAQTVSVLRGFQAYPMQRIHPDGFFEAVLQNEFEFFYYRLSITLPASDGRRQQTYEIDDPYRYPPVLTDFDLHLLGEGNHFRLYEKLGARLLEHASSKGVCFAVWAPNAERVSVVGNFNQWDGRRHPMRPRGGSGVLGDLYPRVEAGGTLQVRNQVAASWLSRAQIGSVRAPVGNASQHVLGHLGFEPLRME